MTISQGTKTFDSLIAQTSDEEIASFFHGLIARADDASNFVLTGNAHTEHTESVVFADGAYTITITKAAV